jgi:hypothetical protein
MDTFPKQPAEVLDFDVDFSSFLSAAGGDTLLSAVSVVDAATITIASTAVNVVTGVVKVWLSGGTDGTSYKVTVTATTTGGRVKQHEFRVRVRDI